MSRSDACAVKDEKYWLSKCGGCNGWLAGYSDGNAKHAAARTDEAAWFVSLNKRISGYESAYFASKCGKWKSEWNELAIRKLKYLREEIEDRISEYGADDLMTMCAKEKANAMLAHITAINEVARSMSALAEEMLYHNDLCKMKSFKGMCDITTVA